MIRYRKAVETTPQLRGEESLNMLIVIWDSVQSARLNLIIVTSDPLLFTVKIGSKLTCLFNARITAREAKKRRLAADFSN